MAFSSQGMLSTVLLDNIISVDKEKQQVTVQAGARVQQVHLALTTVMAGVLHRTQFGTSKPTKSPHSRYTSAVLLADKTLAMLALNFRPLHIILHYATVLTVKAQSSQYTSS